MGAVDSCCVGYRDSGNCNQNDLVHNQYLMNDHTKFVTPDILMREDILQISKLSSLQIITSKLTKKIKKFICDAKLTSKKDINSTYNSIDLKIKTKYLLQTEQLTHKLKIKKNHVKKQINNLKKSFNHPILQTKLIFELKKMYVKYDECLDKISEEIFEIERSYQNEYPEIITNRSNSKFTNDGNSLRLIKNTNQTISNKTVENPRPKSEKNIMYIFDNSKKKDESPLIIKNTKNFGEMVHGFGADNIFNTFRRKTINKLFNQPQRQSKSLNRRFMKTNTSITLESCDKNTFNSLRSKSVYKEEKQELVKTLGKIFEKYHVSDAVVNKRLKLNNEISKKTNQITLNENQEQSSIAQESQQESTLFDESMLLHKKRGIDL